MYTRRARIAWLLGGLLAATLPGGAQTWDQAYGNLANTGFVNIDTNLPVAARWAYLLDGPVSTGGPSVAPDGTVYLGTANGTLWGFWPTGTPRCRADFKGSEITSTPAILPGGDVAFLLQRPSREGWQGDLVRLSADCVVVWQAELPRWRPDVASVSSASVKVWTFRGEPFLFVHARLTNSFVSAIDEGFDTFNELLVYDQTGAIFARHPVGEGCINLSGGSSDVLGDVWDWLTSWWPEAGTVPPLYETYGWPDSTPAIVDTFLPDYASPESPLVAVTDSSKGCDSQLRVLQFFPIAPKPEDRLVQRWATTLSTNDVLLSSPAVTAEGRVAIGTSNSLIKVLDLSTRSQAWQRNVKEPMMHPPAMAPDVWIAGSDYRVHFLKPSSGGLISTGRSNPAIVPSRAGALATSRNEVVIPNQDELSIWSHDQYHQTHAAPDQIFRTSHPALSADGRLYVIAQTVEKSVLIAY